MDKVIYESGFLITMDNRDRLIEKGYMIVERGKILEIGRQKDLDQRKYSETLRVDCSGKVLLPGFISTHTHLFQTLLKGLGRDKPLLEWLDSSVRRALHCYDEEMIGAAALAGLCENLYSGVTTVMDYQYCHVLPEIDFAVTGAMEQLGIRGVLASGRTNLASLPPDMACSYVETEDQFFQGVENLAGKYGGHPLISVAIAPGIIWDMTEGAFFRTREMADHFGIPITMHTVETPDDDEFCRNTYGMDTISFLDRCGLFGPDFSLVHAVWLQESDIALIAEKGASVSHCPAANMVLGSGRADVPGMIDKGVTVSLGNDGPASNDNQDMFEGMKLSALQHKQGCCDPSVLPAYEVLKMATINGARTIGQESRIGSLEAGKEADFIIFNPARDPACRPLHDPVAALVYSATSRGVESVYVRGNPVLQDGHIPHAGQIFAAAEGQAEKLVRQAGLDHYRNNWVR